MISSITPRTATWPPQLSELGPLDPPKRLFVEGRPLDPEASCIAVVGTRRPTSAGAQAARTITKELAGAGYTIVSGLAVGIDAIAHQAALDAGGQTIAVVGCGLDVDYPKRNRALRKCVREKGTIVSEYPAGTQPQPFFFPRRNRIIAGLSLGVVVVEGGIQSGGLVTARLALDSNRNVYAVPGSIRNPMAAGPNELIRRGEAALVTTGAHVLEDLDPNFAARGSTESDDAPQDDPDPRRRRVLERLDDSPTALDELARHCDLAPAELSATLLALEMDGRVERLPGGYARA